MIRGLYTSALGMVTQMKKLDVISNNIANVNTTGYKTDGVVTQSFSEQLMRHIDNEKGSRSFAESVPTIGRFSQGLFVDNVYTNFDNGSLKSTGSPLDLGITGPGFFTVKNQDGQERYSRDGAFTLSPEGYIVTKDGFRVQGQGGDIQLPNGYITITEAGEVYVNAEKIDDLKMVDFDDKTKLRKEGANLYTTIGGINITPFTGRLEQGFLENSNVNSVKEMVEMINISRTYEANQKMVTTHDQTLQRAVNDIAGK